MTVESFEPFLSAEEAVEKLKECGIPVSERTLTEYARTKRLPSCKMNGRRRFRLSQLLSHYNAQAAETTENKPRGKATKGKAKVKLAENSDSPGGEAA